MPPRTFLLTYQESGSYSPKSLMADKASVLVRRRLIWQPNIIRDLLVCGNAHRLAPTWQGSRTTAMQVSIADGLLACGTLFSVCSGGFCDGVRCVRIKRLGVGARLVGSIGQVSQKV